MVLNNLFLHFGIESLKGRVIVINSDLNYFSWIWSRIDYLRIWMRYTQTSINPLIHTKLNRRIRHFYAVFLGSCIISRPFALKYGNIRNWIITKIWRFRTGNNHISFTEKQPKNRKGRICPMNLPHQQIADLFVPSGKKLRQGRPRNAAWISKLRVGQFHRVHKDF